MKNRFILIAIFVLFEIFFGFVILDRFDLVAFEEFTSIDIISIPFALLFLAGTTYGLFSMEKGVRSVDVSEKNIKIEKIVTSLFYLVSPVAVLFFPSFGHGMGSNVGFVEVLFRDIFSVILMFFMPFFICFFDRLSKKARIVFLIFGSIINIILAIIILFMASIVITGISM